MFILLVLFYFGNDASRFSVEKSMDPIMRKSSVLAAIYALPQDLAFLLAECSKVSHSLSFSQGRVLYQLRILHILLSNRRYKTKYRYNYSNYIEFDEGRVENKPNIQPPI